MSPKQLKWLIGVVLVGMLTACASSAPLRMKPDDAVSKAEYAIAQAQQNEASEYAPLPLYEARQKLERAQSLINQPQPSVEDYAEAERLAEKAAMDATLAQSQAAAAQAQEQVEQVQESIETLRQELNREGVTG